MEKGRNYDFQSMMEALLDAYMLLHVVKDDNGSPLDYTILDVNTQFETITQKCRSEVVGNSIRQHLPGIDDNWDFFVRSMPQSKNKVQFDLYSAYTDRYFRHSAFCPQEGQTAVFFREITALKRLQDAYRIHEILFENAHDIMLYIRDDGRIVNANKRALSSYGYSKEELLRLHIQELRDPSTALEYDLQMKKAQESGIVFESVHMRKDGTKFPVEVSAKTTLTGEGYLRVHIIRDITLRKEGEKKIAWFANHDALTGIANRAHFLTQLEQAIQHSKRSGDSFALMLFDIDKFKTINDEYGHEAGDLTLKHVANAASRVLRSVDLVARFGGDEFVVLQTDISKREDIKALANRLQSAANETIVYNNTPLHVHISIGISVFPEHAEDAGGLLHSADIAMYQAKHSGGASFRLFDPQFTQMRE